jgi:putative flippase GtrA
VAGAIATLLSRLPLISRLRSPLGVKLFRYSMASVVAVIVSVICLIVFNGALGITAWIASTLATAIGAVPSYEMNRKWAWGKSGRSHLAKEVLPFWALAFLGWGFSTWCVNLTDTYNRHNHVGHLAATTFVAFVYVAAFGVLWVAKFIIFEKWMFGPRKAPSVTASRAEP